MNGFTWIQNRYCLQSSTNLENYESRSFEGKTLDGRHVYILKEQFNLLPKEIQDAFKKINHLKFQEFQHLTWEIQAIANKKENYSQLQKIINIDILKILMPYLSVNTKQVFYLSSHHLSEVVGKTNLKDICEHAALEDNLEILKWARKNGAPWSVWTCVYAARAGHLDLLKWARDNGAPWDEWTSRAAATYAARRGRLDILKWAKENGAPWDEWTCAYAAKGGHLEMLKWARGNGAPWNIAEIRRWATTGAIEWLNANP